MDKYICISLLCNVLLCIFSKVVSTDCQNGKCMECPGPYFYNGTSCQQCSTRCKSCESLDNCTQCGKTFGLHRGYCTPCEEGCASCTVNKNKTCESCNVYMSKCQQCLDGYGKDVYDTCFRCPTNCRSCLSQGSCEECEDKSFKDTNQLCISCPTNCTSCESSENCTACQDGFHGPLCNSKCLSGCLNNRCDKVTGACRCQDGLYGPNCSYICPKNCVSCQLSNCLECKETRQEMVCNVCVQGKQGQFCDQDCPKNCKTCSLEEQCTRCTEGYHGRECELTCSGGCINRTCHIDSGKCAEGCISGTEGIFCVRKMRDSSLKPGSFIGIGGGVALFVISIVVLVVKVTRYRRQTLKIGSENNAMEPRSTSYLQLDTLNQSASLRENEYSVISLTDSDENGSAVLRRKSYQPLEVSASKDKAYIQITNKEDKEKEEKEEEDDEEKEEGKEEDDEKEEKEEKEEEKEKNKVSRDRESQTAEEAGREHTKGVQMRRAFPRANMNQRTRWLNKFSKHQSMF